MSSRIKIRQFEQHLKVIKTSVFKALEFDSYVDVKKDEIFMFEDYIKNSINQLQQILSKLSEVKSDRDKKLDQLKERPVLDMVTCKRFLQRALQTNNANTESTNTKDETKAAVSKAEELLKNNTIAGDSAPLSHKDVKLEAQKNIPSIQKLQNLLLDEAKEISLKAKIQTEAAKNSFEHASRSEKMQRLNRLTESLFNAKNSNYKVGKGVTPDTFCVDYQSERSDETPDTKYNDKNFVRDDDRLYSDSKTDIKKKTGRFYEKICSANNNDKTEKFSGRYIYRMNSKTE